MLKTVPAPHMTIDPYSPMATGRRARVRRRLLVMVAAAAAVLAVATGSALVVGRNEALPATPSPTTPTQSTTPRSLTAQLGLPGGPFTAVLDAGATKVDLQRSDHPHDSPGLAVTVPASPGAASCRVSRALLVRACAVRAPVREGITAYTDPAFPEVTPSPPVVGRFSVSDVSVVVVAASATDLPHVRGAVWELDDGTVADSSGTPVPQAHGRAVPVEVFTLPLDRSYFIGLRADGFEGWVASGPADFTGSGAPYTGMGGPSGDYYAYLLPAAAASGEVRPGSGRVDSQEILVLGGRQVLVAHLTGVTRFHGPTVQWVDGDGGVHPITE